MTCLNCTAEITGNFCYECGHKSTDVKYTLKGMLSDFFLSTFHIEKKGLPYTVRELTLRPGTAIQKVIGGHRQYLYPAFKYLILMGALVVIFSLRYKFFHNEASAVSESKVLPMWLGLDMADELFFESFFKFAEDEATLLNIMAVPVFTLFSWLLLSRGRFNFAENLILNTYITGQQLFFLLCLSPIFEFLPQSKPMLIGIYTIGIVVYNTWAYIQFFSSGETRISTTLLSLLAVIFSFVYQFPLNVLVYYVYEHFVHPNIHWVPSITP